MNIHTRKRAILMRSVDRRNDSFGADTEGFALSAQRKAQITRRNAVSAQEPKKFALSSQRKLSVLLVVGIVILSAKDCDMKPMGPGGGGGDPDPVYQHPLASTLSPAGPLSLARTVPVDHGATLVDDASFGASVAFAGDLDGGGGTVLAVGSWGDDVASGAIYLLSYDDEGTLQSTKKIAHGIDETNGGAATKNTLAPALANFGLFGTSLANAGDLYGDGNTVLAVGAQNDSAGGNRRGAIYLLSFSTSGNLTATTKIASGTDNAPSLADNDGFGSGLANAGDLDGGGGTVLAVGAWGDDTGGSSRGAIHLLSFNASGALTGSKKIGHKVDETNEGDALATTLAPSLADGDNFGSGIAYTGDLDGGGGTVLAVGAMGSGGRGAIYLLSFNDTGRLQSAKKIAHASNGTDTADNLAPILAAGDDFGRSLTNAGDLDGGGGTVLVVGAENDNTGPGTDVGAIYLLSFSATGNLTATTKIAHGTDKGPVLSAEYYFGSGLAIAGNLDGSGGRVLVVGGSGISVAPINKTGALQLLYFSPPAEE